MLAATLLTLSAACRPPPQRRALRCRSASGPRRGRRSLRQASSTPPRSIGAASHSAAQPGPELWEAARKLPELPSRHGTLLFSGADWVTGFRNSRLSGRSRLSLPHGAGAGGRCVSFGRWASRGSGWSLARMGLKFELGPRGAAASDARRGAAQGCRVERSAAVRGRPGAALRQPGPRDGGGHPPHDAPLRYRGAAHEGAARGPGKQAGAQPRHPRDLPQGRRALLPAQVEVLEVLPSPLNQLSVTVAKWRRCSPTRRSRRRTWRWHFPRARR